MENKTTTIPQKIELKRRILELAIPLGIFFLLLPSFEVIDLALAKYRLSITTHDWIYKYGVLPGQVAASVCLGLLLSKKWRSWALYLLLVLAVGAGIIGHGIFKRYWDRPRPKQIEQLGGRYPYIPIYKSYKGKKTDHLRSLPSGHSTMGFYFYALYFIGRRGGNFKIAYSGLLIGTALGLLLSLARISQGGHFFSDCIASALIMWETAALLDWVFERKYF